MSNSRKDIKERMSKLEESLEKFCGRAVQIMAMGILIYLSYWTAVSTFRCPLDYTSRLVLQYADSPVKNLLVTGAAVLVFYLFRRLFLGRRKAGIQKRLSFIALVDVFVVGIVLSIWVSVSGLEPTTDPQMVYNAVESFRQGDYSVIQKLYYFQMYPYQFGLILFEEALTLVWHSYRVIQYVNVFFICLIVYMLYRITDLIFNDPAADLYCLMGATAFLPIHLYVTYVYGDICSISLILVVVWCLLKWAGDPKWRYMVLTVGCAFVALLARKNTLIPLVAVIMMCLFLAWKKWSWKPLLLGVCLLIMSLGTYRGVKAFYELRSGMEITEGLPAATWIAMGMQGEWGAHGIWNGFTEHTWWRFLGEEDAQEKRKEFVYTAIQEYLEEFTQNPEVARDYYRLKILEQWAEPSYSSLMMNGDSAIGKGGLTEWIYVGVFPDLIYRYQNYYQFLLYFLALCSLLNSLRHKVSIQDQILLIILLGGFLFSVLWEARAKYVLPYAALLIPYMAQGVCVIQGVTGRLKKQIRSRTGRNDNML